MKTQKTRYHKPDFDGLVASKIEEIKSQIAVSAESYALRDQPPPQCRDVRPYFEEDHMKYQALLDEVNLQLQFQTICHHVKEHRQATDDKLREVYNKQTAAKEDQIRIDTQLKDKHRPFGVLRVPLIWLATGVLCLFDGTMALPVFETFGYGFVEASIMGILYAFVLAVIAHVFQKIVSVGRTPLQRRLIGSLLLVTLTLLFYTMASSRAEYLEQEISDDTLKAVHFSPLPFALISLLLLVAAIAVHRFYYPTPEQRATLREYAKLKRAKHENDSAQQRLNEQQAGIEQEHAEVRHMNASILEYGASLEDLTITKAKEGYALFKKHNTAHRRDGFRPLAFDVTGYPFHFTTNFHQVKQIPQS
jgi:hypothetical protein